MHTTITANIKDPKPSDEAPETGDRPQEPTRRPLPPPGPNLGKMFLGFVFALLLLAGLALAIMGIHRELNEPRVEVAPVVAPVPELGGVTTPQPPDNWLNEEMARVRDEIVQLRVDHALGIEAVRKESFRRGVKLGSQITFKLLMSGRTNINLDAVANAAWLQDQKLRAGKGK